MEKPEDLNVMRILKDMKAFLDKAENEGPGPASLLELRELFQDIIDVKYGESESGSLVSFEVFDAKNDDIKIIRTPHLHRIRDPHSPGGASLSEVMESIELMAVTASNAVRSMAGEISFQEREREQLARHIAMCVPVRKWGEKLQETHPQLSRMLILYACDGVTPKLIDAQDASYLGFNSEFLSSLLNPTRSTLFRDVMIEMAKENL